MHSIYVHACIHVHLIPSSCYFSTHTLTHTHIYTLAPTPTAFTELQTDLADLVQISDANLPYRDFRSFAMRFLFPHAGSDHPILLPLQLPEKTDQDKVVENLKSFQSLIMDKKFLLVFVRTLEGQGGRFTLQDKCSVASLLMVSFQNDLDYATE